MTDTDESADDALQVRRPPVGLTRGERRAWREQEAQRLSERQEQAGGFRAVRATTPPRGLGSSGRRLWREADRQSRSRLLRAEAARTESDRYVGALVLLAVVAIVIGLRLILTEDPADQPPNPAPVTTTSLVSVSVVQPLTPAQGRGE